MTDWLKELLAMVETTLEDEVQNEMPQVLLGSMGAAIHAVRADRSEAEIGGSTAELSVNSENFSGPNGRKQAGGASALRTLYRQAGEAVRGAVSTAGPAAQTVIVQERTGGGVGLTAAELDRAVRRDSRRYDGGMSIY